MRTFVIVGALCLAACSTTTQRSSSSDREVAVGRDFDLAVGERAHVKGWAVYLKFERVLEESRCPMNARCIWEGNAKVEIDGEEMYMQFNDGIVESIEKKLELNTSGRFAQRQPFGKLDVVLVHLEPTPMAGQTVEKYVATLRVEARP